MLGDHARSPFQRTTALRINSAILCKMVRESLPNFLLYYPIALSFYRGSFLQYYFYHQDINIIAFIIAVYALISIHCATIKLDSPLIFILSSVYLLPVSIFRTHFSVVQYSTIL